MPRVSMLSFAYIILNRFQVKGIITRACIVQCENMTDVVAGGSRGQLSQFLVWIFFPKLQNLVLELSCWEIRGKMETWSTHLFWWKFAAVY